MNTDTNSSDNGSGPPDRRRIRQLLGATVLNIAAIGGAICLLGVAAAWIFDVTIILFKTGSMEPTIPAGSAALVREIPAAHVQVGDIVTVDRTNALPVTHRVIDITPGDGEARVITLQGDANPAPDATPYTVEQVRIVLGWVPGVAPWIATAQRPQVMILVTVAVTALVVWTLWPRTREAPVDTASVGSGEPHR